MFQPFAAQRPQHKHLGCAIVGSPRRCILRIRIVFFVRQDHSILKIRIGRAVKIPHHQIGAALQGCGIAIACIAGNDIIAIPQIIPHLRADRAG